MADQRTALVITVSDGVAAGAREDAGGAAVAERLEGLGFAVERALVPDERPRIEGALVEAAARHPLVVTTGGTGLTPRDVTPQATLAVLDYQVPGFAEAMRADGRTRTPLAILSRAVVGVRGRSLIVNLPGSPRGAIESLAALEPVLGHALDTLAGPFDHAEWPAAEAGPSPGRDAGRGTTGGAGPRSAEDPPSGPRSAGSAGPGPAGSAGPRSAEDPPSGRAR